HASAALAYPLRVPAGGTADVVIAVPLHDAVDVDSLLDTRRPAAEAFEARLERVVAAWRTRAGDAGIDPPDDREWSDVKRTLDAQVGWILVNRDGPAIQP